MRKRASGILLHITSLPSKYGIGDFGPRAYGFADFLARGRQNYWQLLPLNPISPKGNYSPYNCTSAFAGNTLLISPELLYRRGLLTKKHLQNTPAFPEACVNYRLVSSYKARLLNAAYQQFKHIPPNSVYEQFCSKNENWLEDYAAFAVLRRYFWPRLWCNWPAELRDRKRNALESVKAGMQDDINREKFLQYIFFAQWFALKRHCNQKGIRIIGDIPIYLAYDSADLWSHPDIFKLTRAKKPRFIAGVPPDFFSRTGQLWANPVYDWKALRSTAYSWWFQRIKHCLSLFDIVRLDHFRGFAAYWQVPAGRKTAVKGRWVNGPKEDFFYRLFRRFPVSSFIVEDLGYITADVKALIDRFELTCMKVLLFAFDGSSVTNPHCPHNYVKNSIVYTGTHDNNTIRGWFEKQAKPDQRKKLFDYLGRSIPAAKVHWELIRLAAASAADTVIIPVQDVLGLDEQARMNRPASRKGNWIWRLRPGRMTASIGKKLARLAEIYGRA